MMKHQRLVRIDDQIMGDAGHAEITGEFGRGIDAAGRGGQHLDDDDRRRNLDR